MGLSLATENISPLFSKINLQTSFAIEAIFGTRNSQNIGIQKNVGLECPSNQKHIEI